MALNLLDVKNEESNKQSLPSGPPTLCFNKEEFMKSNFNVEHFVVECRRHTTLDVLRNDLHIYLKILESAMIELINKDYADFLNLSTNLVGMDKVINSLILPVNNIKSEIMVVKTAVTEKIKEIDEKLKIKTKIREKKENLKTMMKIVQSLENMEKLLGLSTNRNEVDSNNNGDNINNAQKNKTRKMNSKHLIGRVALDFNQLQFHIENNQHLPLVKQVEPRAKAISDTLLISLEASLRECFLNSSNSSSGSSGSSSSGGSSGSGSSSGSANNNTSITATTSGGDGGRSTAASNDLQNSGQGDLVTCLRTYATINQTQRAESLFRDVVVKDYMQEVIGEQVIKERGLKYMYDKVLEFIPKYCAALKSITSNSLDAVVGYDFIVNAVWPEVVNHLEFRTPSIFAPGNPDIFHKAYTTSMDFINRFELQLTSQASVRRLRAHQSYASFMAKWGVSVYFQIRFQEIGGQLELSLMQPLSLVKDMKDKGDTYLDNNFSLVTTLTLCRCVTRCWSSSVYLESLLHRFWKLSMQCVARYNKWLIDLTKEISALNDSAKTTNNIPRVESMSSVQGHMVRRSLDPSDSNSTFTPIPPAMSTSCLPSLNNQQNKVNNVTANGSNDSNSNVQIDALICLIVLCDIRKLTLVLDTIFDREITPVLLKVNGVNVKSAKEAWKDGITSLLQHIPTLTQFISNEVTTSCVAHLKSVNNIPRLYKRTNREIPTKASAYVATITKPLSDFIREHKDGSSSSSSLLMMADDDERSIINNVLSNVTEAYTTVTGEVLTSVKRMEESLKRLKAARGTSVETGNQGMTDDDKIRLQLSLDVQAYSDQAVKLGSSHETNALLDKLKEVVSSDNRSS